MSNIPKMGHLPTPGERNVQLTFQRRWPSHAKTSSISEINKSARFQQSDIWRGKKTQRQTFRSTLQVPTRLLRLPACWPVLGTACAVPVVGTDALAPLRNSSKPPRLRLKTAKAGVWPYGWVLAMAEAENPISPTNIKPGGTNPQNVMLPFINGIPQLVNWCKLGVC